MYRQSLIDIKKKLKQYTDNAENLSFSTRLEVERLFSVANDIDSILLSTYPSIEDTIKAYSSSQARQGYYGVWYSIEQAENIALQFPLINHDYVMNLVNAPVAGKRLSKRLYQYRNKLAENVTQNIINGLFEGKSYAEIARRVNEETEASYKQALRIARTEAGRTQSTTTQKGYVEAKKKGIDIQKRWLATLDKKTRHDHRELDGQTIEVDEKFSVRGHTAEGPRLFGVASEDVNCRCTTIEVIDGITPELRKDNETKAVVKYKKYDDWLNNKTQSNVLKPSIFDQTNMNKAVGQENYTAFLESLNSLEDSSIKTLLNKFGDQLEFNSLSDSKDFVRDKLVQLSQNAFDGTAYKNPLQTVFHELGHAIDNIGIESFDSEYDRISEMPKYKLKNDIKNDLLNLFNNDLAEIKGDDYQKLKNLKKMDIFDQGAIVRKYKKLAEENPKMYSSLSDMMESTNAFIDHPLGSGHGLNYWKSYGRQEAEFFAHMAETVVNEDSKKMMYELFPTASKKWEQMIDDILEAVK